MHRQLPLASSRLPSKLSVPRSKEANWLRQLRAGEPTAWLHLIEHWSPRLYNYALYLGVSEAEAQTLLPMIFAEVVQGVVGELRVANLTVLIFSITYQHVLNHCRQRPTPRRPLPSLAASSATMDDQQRAFLQTLWQFTPEVQQLLLLYYLYEVTLPELAQIVGQPEEVLTKVLFRFKHYLP